MTEFPFHLAAFWLAIVLDLGFGDPPNAVHPVAWFGRLVSVFLRLAPKRGRWLPLVFGSGFVFASAATAAAGTYFLRQTFLLPETWNVWQGLLAVLIEAVVLKCTFSMRGLYRAGQAVRGALARRDLESARALLGRHLVSRETSALDESQVAAATIESLSENASDSCLAPWLFYLAGGLPGAVMYRVINTCDAMMGYRDPDREWLGKAAARLDDLVNLVPSRITAWLIIAASGLLKLSPSGGARIWFRDRRLTASPNAGHPMSAAAGALGVRLEKVGHYCLAEEQRPPTARDILHAERLIACAMFLAMNLLSVGYFLFR